jgi:hypothetical protein
MSAPTRPSHTPDRLRRAWRLVLDGKVARVGPTQFQVAGNQEPHYDVDLSVDPACYCADRQHRNTPCKHELSARLAMHDTSLLLALVSMMDFKPETDDA